VEWAEDKESEGKKAIDAMGISDRDVLIGITASGQAPFVIGAMKRAGQLSAKVAALGCNRNSKTFAFEEYKIYIDAGPEIITGSTRMKSGTAQKLVLNMITTTAIVMVLLGVSRQKAESLLSANEGRIGPALDSHHKSS
jgi:N-acetylmuramic acid 6-phosphate etherase